ncbi:uncharacterized protein JCM15063_006407 [Sporobolomyces koalae]|uniref:uncharacterized protein n=1 Tax=Sporobolomyces koalae TaxID=500713 RepID=UPI00317808BE
MPPRKRSSPASSPLPTSTVSPAKRAKVEESDLPGHGIWKSWPAPRDQMENAKSFIREAVEQKHRILLCPDKDADGLSSCLVIYRTLTQHLSHPPNRLQVYFLPKGVNIHSDVAQQEMLAVKFDNLDSNGSAATEYEGPTRAIIMDQGSRPGPALLPPDKCSTLLIDHHQSREFPESIQVLSACQSEPVATTSILTYLLCCELVPELKDDRECSMGALLGLYGDLGASKINLSDPTLPWPTWLAQWEKTLTKTKLSKATALLNAPRRTPEFNALIAWNALNACKGDLKRVMDDRALGDAKERTSSETTKWQGAAPKFSKDGKVAVIRVDSGFQIHPVIATRWQGTLRKAKTLVAIMCANTGYTPGKVHFSCRAPRRSPDDPHYNGPPDLIEYLKSCIPLCEELSPGWGERVGHDFARAAESIAEIISFWYTLRQQATGGIIPVEEFEVLIQALEVGVKAEKKEGTSPTKKSGKGVIDPSQKTTLDGFFGIKPKKE